MEPLTPAELDELRAMIKDERMSDADKDEIIRILDNVVQSFILQARGLDVVQLSLTARANASFQPPQNCDSLSKYDIKERVDLGCPTGREGVIENQSPNAGPRRPENS